MSEWEGRILRGDNREHARQMAAESVQCDVIFCSPPYPQNENTKRDRSPIGFDRDGQPRKPRARERVAAAVGHVHNQPNLKGETGLEVKILAPDWLDWFLTCTAAWKPVLRPNGNLIVNVDSCCYPTRHRHWGVFSLPERMEALGYCFVDALLWTKPNGPPVSAQTRFNHSWEFVYWFSNGDRWEADIDAVRTEHRSSWGTEDTGGWRKGWQTADGKIAKEPNPNGARPKDIFPCPLGGTRWESVGGAHFAAMPLALAEWCLKWGSKPGELVWDPFCGAGTTLVAAERLGRRWLGSELTEAAYVLAERRTQLATQGFFDEGYEPETAVQKQLALEAAE